MKSKSPRYPRYFIVAFVLIIAQFLYSGCIPSRQFEDLKKERDSLVTDLKTSKEYNEKIITDLTNLQKDTSAKSFNRIGLAIDEFNKAADERLYQMHECGDSTEYLYSMDPTFPNILKYIHFKSGHSSFMSNIVQISGSKKQNQGGDSERNENLRNLWNLKTTIGNIVFYCDTVMTEGIASDLSAFLGNVVLKEEDLLNYVIKSINKTRADLHSSPITKNDLRKDTIDLGEYVDIQLQDPEEKFFIDTLSKPTKKRIISGKPISWQWSVMPLQNTGGYYARINLLITSFDKDENKNLFPTRSYSIYVRIKENYWVELWKTILKDPKWPITAVVLPIITFYAGKWKEKRKKDSKPNRKRSSV